MSASANTSCVDALNRAMTLARNGRLDEARAILLALLDAMPDHPDALQVMGLVERSAGDNPAAEEWLRRSLLQKPDQPHVQNNLGNVLMDLGRTDEALEAYRRALELKPQDRDALVNFGRAALETGSPEVAATALERAVRIHPDHRQAWTALAEARKVLGQFRDGLAAARRALALCPGHVPSLAILGICHRFAGDAELAIEALESAVAGNGANPGLQCALAYAYCEAGRIEEAVATFRQALALEPDLREAHDGLNDLLWQYGPHDRYMDSYPAALQQSPRSPGLWADWARRLSFAGRIDEALAILRHAQDFGIEAPALDHRRGQIHCARGDYEAGLLAYRQALDKDPADTTTRVDTVRALLAAGNFAAACNEADGVLARAPFHQEAIAYQSLAWRFLGDPRAAQLNDYDRFVAVMDLDPLGGSSRDDFNEHLARRIRDLHHANQHPADQTLRGGTQTMGDLLGKNIPELAMLRRMLESAIHRYIAALPDDSGHVFLRRKSEGFRFSGSWSVRLQSGGYHLNHVHSQGWISACYYLEVPDSVADSNRRAGWLKLGESNMALGSADRPARHVQPAPGRLVLFPSYMYHGTVPFHGDVLRTTIAFDIVPE